MKLVHVVQNERGEFDDDEREREAYELEQVLFNQFNSTATLLNHENYHPSRLCYVRRNAWHI